MRGSWTDWEQGESEGIQGKAKISKARAIDQGAERDWRKAMDWLRWGRR